jgi:hypothetical protein
MTTGIRTLLHKIEGPRAQVEVFEIEVAAAGGSSEIQYEVVVAGAVKKRVRALGHAYIVAEELAGARS